MVPGPAVTGTIQGQITCSLPILATWPWVFGFHFCTVGKHVRLRGERVSSILLQVCLFVWSVAFQSWLDTGLYSSLYRLITLSNLDSLALVFWGLRDGKGVVCFEDSLRKACFTVDRSIDEIALIPCTYVRSSHCHASVFHIIHLPHHPRCTLRSFVKGGTMHVFATCSASEHSRGVI